MLACVWPVKLFSITQYINIRFETPNSCKFKLKCFRRDAFFFIQPRKFHILNLFIHFLFDFSLRAVRPFHEKNCCSVCRHQRQIGNDTKHRIMEKHNLHKPKFHYRAFSCGATIKPGHKKLCTSRTFFLYISFPIFSRLLFFWWMLRRRRSYRMAKSVL